MAGKTKRTRRKPVDPKGPAAQEDGAVVAAVEKAGGMYATAKSDGSISGLDASQDYLIFKVGDQTKVQAPPAAKMRPPVVRRSVLVLLESDDEEFNPVAAE